MALSMMSMLGCKVKEFQKLSRIFQLGVCSVQNKRIIHASPVVYKKKNPTPQEGNEIEKAVKDVASQFGENKAEVEEDLTKQVNKVMNGKDSVGKKTFLKGEQKSKNVMKETVSKVLNMDVDGLEHKEYDNSHKASDAEMALNNATEADPGGMSKTKRKRNTKLKSDDYIKVQQTKQSVTTDKRNFQRENLKQKRETSVMRSVRRPDNIVGKTRNDLSRSLPYQRVRTSRLQTEIDYKIKKINIFGAEALKIFDSKKQKLNKVCDNTFHEKLEDESAVKFQTNLIPLNGFQEMIQQTLEGKLWRFPIDNEQDWASEENVPFHEHVFLEDAIEDFPKQGPIRNFMELVITGLSKNPYLTVKEKHEHIDWYRQYFKQPEKQAVLLEALGERAKFTELKQLGAE